MTGVATLAGHSGGTGVRSQFLDHSIGATRWTPTAAERQGVIENAAILSKKVPGTLANGPPGKGGAITCR